MIPRDDHEGNIEVEGKQNSLFPEGPVIKCFVTPPDSKIEKVPKKIICLSPLHTLAALAKLSGCRKQPVLSKNNDMIFLMIFSIGSQLNNRWAEAGHTGNLPKKILIFIACGLKAEVKINERTEGGR